MSQTKQNRNKSQAKHVSIPTETPMGRVMPPATNCSHVCTHVSQQRARIALCGIWGTKPKLLR